MLGHPSIFSQDELEKIAQDNKAFFDLVKEKNVTLPALANLDETLEEFNDMGYMQAIDLITAIEAVKVILRENQLLFNANRLIGYGHSHGAYLLHLCNRLVPHLFSFIIDNSAWIEPVYLFSNRYLFQNLGQARLRIEFDYLAKKVIKNKHNLNLKRLYQDYTGKTQIITFQGDNIAPIRMELSCALSLDTSAAYGQEGMNWRKGCHDLGAMEEIIILRPPTFEGPSF